MKINHKKHTDEKKNHQIRSAVKKKKKQICAVQTSKNSLKKPITLF